MNEPKHLIKDWAEVPQGMCLIRMKHERTGEHCLHMHLKRDDGPWYDQPPVPFHAETVLIDRHRAFWVWAADNLPAWDYPHPVKSAC